MDPMEIAAYAWRVCKLVKYRVEDNIFIASGNGEEILRVVVDDGGFAIYAPGFLEKPLYTLDPNMLQTVIWRIFNQWELDDAEVAEKLASEIASIDHRIKVSVAGSRCVVNTRRGSVVWHIKNGHAELNNHPWPAVFRPTWAIPEMIKETTSWWNSRSGK